MAITNNNTAIISKLTNLELSIQISLSGLSFCILHRDNNSISTLKEVRFKKQFKPIRITPRTESMF
nr:DUF3822 family protein [Algibacter lectus]